MATKHVYTSMEPALQTPAPLGPEAGFEFVDLQIVKPEESAMMLAPGDFALKNQVLPMAMDGEVLIVAMGSLASLTSVDDLGILIHKPVRAVLADPNLIKERIEEYF